MRHGVVQELTHSELSVVELLCVARGQSRTFLLFILESSLHWAVTGGDLRKLLEAASVLMLLRVAVRGLMRLVEQEALFEASEVICCLLVDEVLLLADSRLRTVAELLSSTHDMDVGEWWLASVWWLDHAVVECRTLERMARVRK